MDGSEKKSALTRPKQQTMLRKPVQQQSQTVLMYSSQDEQPEVSYSSGQIITMGEDGNQYIITEDMLAQAGMISDGNVLYVAEDGNAVAMDDLIEEDPQQVYDQTSEDAAAQPEYMECQDVVTEEVITDDWVQQSQDGEFVEVTVAETDTIPADEDDVSVPLPTDQDEYTTSRPYPCDFCSRRFRKKANLMNHMVAHQNDRPHVCNLCGARYIRKCDLLNHLKIHAYIPDEHELNDNPLEEYPDNLSSPDYELDMLMGGYARTIPTIKSTKRKASVASKAGGRKKVYSPLPYRRAPKRGILDDDDVDYDPEMLAKQETDGYGQTIVKYPVTDSRKPFVCQQCGVAFAREKALSSHAKIHAGDSTVECELCGDILLNQAQLKEHTRKHHRDQTDSDYNAFDDDSEDEEVEPPRRTVVKSEKSKPQQSNFYCDQCGMGFHRNDLLKKHYKTHVKEEADVNFSMGGKRGNEMDDTAEEDGDETEDADEDDSLHCCTVCGEKFSEALDLLAHAEMHARIQYKCSLCGSSFTNEDQVKTHIQQTHGHEMTENSCRLCGKQCKDGRSLMKHAWDHSSEKAHSCSKCGKTFHNKARLKRHMLSHRDKAVVCEICNEEFVDGRTLSNHRHAHTKTNQFECHECGKTFGSRSSQQIHIRIHTGEKPYGCRFCWKAFADGGTLRKHERIHTGEKPYACAVCPRAFNQRVVLREHIRSHHSLSDSKYGNMATPYYCVVCTNLFSTSADLIQHLVAHSDANTQAKRKPITGPRKYKRRRKLKPHELDQIQKVRDSGKQNSNAVMEAYSDDEIKPGMLARYHDDNDSEGDMGQLVRHKPSVSSLRKRVKTSVAEDYARSKRVEKVPPKLMVELTSCIMSDENQHENQEEYDEELSEMKPKIDKIDQSISLSATDAFDVILEAARNQVSVHNDPKVDPTPTGLMTTSSLKKTMGIKVEARKPIVTASTSSSGRPKMIHTQKTRIAVVDGKRKTRTLITKEIKGGGAGSRNSKLTATVVKEKPKQNVGESSFEQVGASVKSSINNLRRSARSAAATVTSSSTSVENEDFLLMEISKKNHYMDKYSDVVNDLEEILRSPIKTSGSKSQVPLADSKLASGSTSRTSARASTRSAYATVTAPQTTSRRPQQPHVVVVTKPLVPKPLQKLTEITELPMKILDIKQEEDLDEQTNRDSLSDLEKAVATNPYKCEMCSASFSDRTQLLLHVPVHI